MKDKNCIILIDGEEVFAKSQQPFIIKILSILGIERMYLNIIKVAYAKPITIIMLNRERLKAFPLKSKTRLVYPCGGALSSRALLVAVDENKSTKT